jgi:hypothetical protein
VLLQHLIDVGEELNGHIIDVLVSLDDIVEDEVSLHFVVGGLLVFDLRLWLDDAPT